MAGASNDGESVRSIYSHMKIQLNRFGGKHPSVVIKLALKDPYSRDEDRE